MNIQENFLNFRDLAQYNNKLKPGYIFRSNSLTSLIEDEFFRLVRENKVASVIDLRSNPEVHSQPYESYMLEYLNYFHVPIDPTQMANDFSPIGAVKGMADVYHFFVQECRPQVKEVFELLGHHASNGIVIHCFAGKDRTGFIAALIHMLAEAPYNAILEDYMASGFDVEKRFLDIIYGEIEKWGGIKAYLNQCGVGNQTLDSVSSQVIA